MRLTAKIIAVVVPMLALVLGLVMLLNYFKGQSLLAAAVEQRASVILQDVRRSLETGLAFGLDLDRFATVQAIITRARQRDAYIEGIYVFDVDGRIVFATDAAAIGAVADGGWLRAHAQATGGTWRLAASDRPTLGSRLASNSSENVGGVALTYALSGVEARADVLLWDMAKAALLLLLGFSLLATAGSFLILRSFRNTFQGLAAAVGDRAGGEAGERDRRRLPPRLRAAAEQFRATVAAADASLDEVERALSSPAIPNRAEMVEHSRPVVQVASGCRPVSADFPS